MKLARKIKALRISHWTPRLADSCDKPHILIAKDAEVIKKFMSKKDTMPHVTAVMNLGWRTMTDIARPPDACSATGFGRRTPNSTTADNVATAACAITLPANRYA